MTIGNDCMFSGGITFRTDDSHAIYDVITGNRINKEKISLLEIMCGFVKTVKY